MWHLGIDLHRHTVVIGAVNDAGEAQEPVTFSCRETEAILKMVVRLKPFRAVIGATATLYFSFATITTLGYGDYAPTTTTGKLLVILEVMCVFFLLLIVLQRGLAGGQAPWSEARSTERDALSQIE